MLDNIFKGLFDTDATSVISAGTFLLCVGTALVCGLVLAFANMYKSTYTKSFEMTLGMLPAVVCVVIMMVNGNVGVGVAVMGAFSLIRFRSVPGSAREISVLFIAMGSGMICGMGYLAFAGLFTIVMCVILIIYSSLNLGAKGGRKTLEKTLNITIPEDLDYTGIFDEVFDKYTKAHELISVRTSNMGSLFKLKYDIVLKDADTEKSFIDELRIRNGNLEINICRAEPREAEL